MSKRWFVTGTDTEVGKTVASCALLQAATAGGYRCAGYKPVATGCEVTAQGLRNEDALALQKYSSVRLPYEMVNPLAFAEPTSPHIISAEQQRPIAASQLSAGLAAVAQRAEWVLTEGAGGWLTPLAASLTFAQWVEQEQMPVILVVGVKLGCINHALLTAGAVLSSGLPLAGWIANGIQPAGKRHREYLATLNALIAAPCLGEIPHLAGGGRDHLGRYLTLP
ncbi:dethiobiotin synthase [Erwinia pyrifoliae]|uniref:ATP-dependent dethiobiotin synthetase BioD n=1 Tax=Erwinia pyrifoliae TaxID=79967 RepID=A0ABY5X4Q0_ERWPY|nr:dethiobiotin synthase [Erwinia pyrifoliae]AUX72158.1 ATP-dependent dethiobiotin synthetase BioD [Erwinia pyrifoliae]MCA8877601.1 ATP-dependent dethiobiotin synthetase BioD [Erwinia pyrifoliae]UWS30467.1 dethiobiotin synthase [Erwinia pyrifoliae]UWS32313.1 dethiobiotin synthase [Erwinia pyrifoliae]UXK13476.1 dethiobiotin synthase [Erwinia pyrifoliae]